jgi:hypothetical protein
MVFKLEVDGCVGSFEFNNGVVEAQNMASIV